MRILCSFLILAFLSGCVSKAKDIKATDALASDEAMVIGRVGITYNGGNLTEHCSICINDTCHRLDKSGFVFQPVKAGKVEMSGFMCKPGTFNSFYHFFIHGADFKAKAGMVNYFGNLSVYWFAGDGLKTSAMFGLVGLAVDYSSNDGELTYIVSDRHQEAVNSYAKELGIPPSSVKFATFLLKDAKANPRTPAGKK